MRVDREAPAFADRRDDQRRRSTGRATRLPLTIEEFSAMAFGRSAPVLHHLDDERLPRRRVEGVDDALERPAAR